MFNQKTTGALPNHRIRPVLAPINRSAISVPCPQKEAFGREFSRPRKVGRHNGPNLEIFQTFTSVDYTMRVQRTCAGYFFPSANVFFSGTNAIFLLSILARHSRECKGYMSIIFTLSYLIFLAFSFFLFFFNFCEHQVCLLTMFSTDESCWWHSMIFLRIWIGN